MDFSAASSPSASASTSDPLQTEDQYEQLKRFQIELEFVQCLANPWYLHNLAQQQYFNQDAFVRYLDYLQYFRKPEYAKFIIYPHCLHFLTLLQHKSFRDSLAKQDTATFVHERQYYHWQYLRNQEKVVRMEIMPDGSRVEIKNEPPQQLQVPQSQALQQITSTAVGVSGQPVVAGPGSNFGGQPAEALAGPGSSAGQPIQVSPNGSML